MCISPIYGILTKGSPKNTLKILPRDKVKNGTFDVVSSLLYGQELVKLPCGQCIECRFDYARKWADRLSLEALDFPEDQRWFLTLTIDDVNIQNNKSTKKDNIYSIHKKDLQDFMKRLRKYYSEHFAKHGLSAPPKIRFFGCGEYGDQSFRPHYHIIIFGIKIADLIKYKVSQLGFIYYVSQTFNNLWPFGFVVIANGSWQTFNYVSRYVMKKQRGKQASFYDDLGVEPEFATMSRKPGLGLNYFKENIDKIYDFDKIYFTDVDKGGMTCRPP